ncbi:hypothetical protein A0256_13650 [Mucilaginibacter sp. PAMC 26640]|nr:hypothetical protein A0256_13650 [Mucilaginibacter sp. PAMC 26640]
MDQKQMDDSFRVSTYANILADLYLGKNLTDHFEKLQTEIEAVDFIINQEGYLHPDINDNLEMKAYIKRLEGHLRKAIVDPSHRPDPEETKNTDCYD